MVLRQALRQLAQSFSLDNIRARLLGQDGRRLQQELDTHKLFLYVNLHLELKSKGAAAIDTATLLAQTQEVPYRQKVVLLQRLVSEQVLEMGDSIHKALVQLGDPAEAAAAFERPPQEEPEPRPPQEQQEPDKPHSGLAYAGMASRTEAVHLAASLAQVSQLAGARVGFRLGVRRSQIKHGAAGDGLFVEEGQVSPGQVVALFPGLVYTKPTYAAMPNYPRVDADNPYLIARYDKAVVDSKPWGRGLPASAPSSWPEATSPAARQLRLLEGRHPYALAHFANHPGAGLQPNTMIAPFTTPRFDAAGCDDGGSGSGRDEAAGGGDGSSGGGSSAREEEGGSSGSGAGGAAGQPGAGELRSSGGLQQQQEQQQQQQQEEQQEGGGGPTNYLARPRLRAYLPNLLYSDDKRWSRARLLEEEVGAVALVACQQINAGEEVFFDYRLSPGLGRPEWYVAVDAKAETRRWS